MQGIERRLLPVKPCVFQHLRLCHLAIMVEEAWLCSLLPLVFLNFSELANHPRNVQDITSPGEGGVASSAKIASSDPQLYRLAGPSSV